MSEDKLMSNINEVKLSTTPNMVNAYLYKLITQESHGTNFSFNMMKILPDGVVKKQSHPEQHAVFILDGKCGILLGEQWVDAKKGDFVYIPENLTHSFTNDGHMVTDILILKLNA